MVEKGPWSQATKHRSLELVRSPSWRACRGPFPHPPKLPPCWHFRCSQAVGTSELRRPAFRKPTVSRKLFRQLPRRFFLLFWTVATRNRAFRAKHANCFAQIGHLSLRAPTGEYVLYLRLSSIQAGRAAMNETCCHLMSVPTLSLLNCSSWDIKKHFLLDASRDWTHCHVALASLTSCLETFGSLESSISRVSNTSFSEVVLHFC